MEKKDYFNKEYNYVKDTNKRNDLILLVSGLPDYFFEIPASSTGKYHPEFAATEHGLVKHTKVATRIAYELLNNPGLNNFTDSEKDIIIMALVLHDGFKSGKIKEKYTRFDHPLLASEYVRENKDKLSNTKIISIGKITTKTILDNGLEVYKESEKASIESMIEAMSE